MASKISCDNCEFLVQIVVIIIIITSLPYFRVKLSSALCLLIEKNSLKLPKGDL